MVELFYLSGFHSFLIFGIGSSVSYVHIVIYKIFDIRIATDESKELMDDTSKEDFLRRQEWKVFRDIKSHLVTKNASSTDSGSVVSIDAFIAYLTQEIQVFLHGDLCSDKAQNQTLHVILYSFLRNKL